MDSPKLLIVEDEAIIAHDIRNTLEQGGYTVTGIAATGEEAIKKAAAARPDLVLMDILLQGDIDGVTTATMIRERLSIPVVYLTAHSDRHTTERAKMSEPYGFILKPVETETLFLTIDLAIHRHRADVMVRESERRYRSLADNMLDMVNQVDTAGRFMYLSPSVKTIMGYEPEEMIGKSVFDYIHPDDRDRLRLEFEEAQKSKRSAGIEFRCRHAMGHYLWMEGRGNNMYDRSGRLTGRIYGTRDITERKHMEHDLRASEMRYRELFDNANDIIYTHDLDGNFTSFNRKAIDISGYTREEGLKMNFRQILPPEYEPVAWSALRSMLKGEAVPAYTLEIITREGRRVWLELSARLLYEDGVPVEVQGIARDITGQRRMSEALRLSEEKFSRAFHSGPGAITLTSLGDARFVEVNESFISQIGYSREELIGRTVSDIHLLENPADEEVISGELMKNGRIRGMELPFRTKSGRILIGLFSADIITIENNSFVLTMVLDITDRKRAEEQIKSALAEKELLMKEVLHRVKNNMSVIHGLLGFQTQYMKDPMALSVFEESRNRIITMMKVNEMMYHSGDFTRVDLNRYISDLTTSLFNSYNIHPDRVTLDLKVDPVPIDIKTAVPCGLIINELISNSLKHAFPGSRQGAIKVSFDREEGPGNGFSYRLAICDDGIGIPQELDWRNAGSMGMNLVTLLVDQLEGSISLCREGGTGFEIRF